MATQKEIQDGQEVLRRLHSFLKTNYNYVQFIDTLTKDTDGTKMSAEDFNSNLASLGKTKVLYSGILYKTRSDFDNILKAVANKTPSDKLPTWRMIQSAMINPKTFKPSFYDMARLATKVTGQAIRTVGEKTASTFNFFDQYKTVILFAGIGYLVLKLLEQSDKVASAYNKISGDIGSTYKTLSKDVVSSYKSIRDDLKQR